MQPRNSLIGIGVRTETEDDEEVVVGMAEVVGATVVKVVELPWADAHDERDNRITPGMQNNRLSCAILIE